MLIPMTESQSPPSPSTSCAGDLAEALPQTSARAKPLPRRLPLVGEPPAQVPARMVNEVLYCERLLYLEWAQGEWDDNFFTVEGRSVHRRADVAGGALPPKPGDPPADPESPMEDRDRPYQARSVWLTSTTLGLTAKIDVVDGDSSGAVRPVEYKRGSAPDVPEGAYLPERAQLAAQVMLLREHGYTCDGGDIYFAASRRRVPIRVDEQLEATVLRAIARAKEITAAAEPPAPLVESPKCMGCSLAGICLPDEVELLRALDDSAPWATHAGPAEEPVEPAVELRRLVPARDDKVPLYVQDVYGRVGLDGDELVAKTKLGETRARLSNTSQVCLLGNIQISSQAMRALLERGIPTAFFSQGGFFYGYLAHLGSKNIELRVAQHRAVQDREFCLRTARTLVASKIMNCRTMLRRNGEALPPRVLDDLEASAERVDKVVLREELLGVEGTAARTYFGAFTCMLKGNEELSRLFDALGRNRRPPRDPVNALLSFTYALLTKEWTVALLLAGLEPLLGVYHQPRFGRPALALDLMEEMRPIIADSVVVNVLNTGAVTADDFVVMREAVSLKPKARKSLLMAYERRMDQLVTHPVFGYRISYRRVLEVQARIFGRTCTGEIAAYPEFRTR